MSIETGWEHTIAYQQHEAQQAAENYENELQNAKEQYQRELAHYSGNNRGMENIASFVVGALAFVAGVNLLGMMLGFVKTGEHISNM